jgi:uncharacterized membrane protein YebE (DUF533 family)
MTSLELPHLQAIVSALHDLAQTDGVHETEKGMLMHFYAQCQQDANALASYADLTREPFDIARVAPLFDSAERKAALLHSCILLGYADGRYSDGERARVAQFAAGLGVDSATLQTIEDAVSDQLLQQISRTTSIESLKTVAGAM